MEGIFGLAAFGFWMFIAAVSLGGIWDGIRKREAEHETLRRMIESGKEPDKAMVDKLIGSRKKPERDLKVGGLIVIFVAPGLALMGAGLALGLEGLARHLRRLGAGLVPDDAAFAERQRALQRARVQRKLLPKKS